MCFEFQGIIFNGKKVLKFSQILMVRPGGIDPPPTVSLTVKYWFFFTTSLRMSLSFSWSYCFYQKQLLLIVNTFPSYGCMSVAFYLYFLFCHLFSFRQLPVSSFLSVFPICISYLYFEFVFPYLWPSHMDQVKISKRMPDADLYQCSITIRAFCRANINHKYDSIYAQNDYAICLKKVITQPV